MCANFNTLICTNCIHREYDEDGDIIAGCHWISDRNKNRVDPDNWCDNKETPEYDIPDYFEYFSND